MLNTIIVDDESKSSKFLNNLVNEYCPQLTVAGIANSVKTAVPLIQEHNPDVLFLDIRLNGKNGFNLLDEVENKNMQVIFTTAYEQYASKAFRYNAQDYLLKPIDIEELKDAVNKVQQRIEERQHENALKDVAKGYQLLNTNQTTDKILGLSTQSGFSFIKIKDILYCKAEGNYCEIFLRSENRTELVTKTLKEFEELLSEHSFFRIHRSYLINLRYIRSYLRTQATDTFDGDGGCVVMDNSTKLPVSRDKRKLLLELFTQPF